MDDHRFTNDESETVGEVADVRARIVFYLRILRTNRSTRNFVDTHGISSRCHEGEQRA